MIQQQFINFVKQYKLLEHNNNILLCSGGKDAMFCFQMILESKLITPSNLKVIMILSPRHMYFEGDNYRKDLKNVLSFIRNKNIELFIQEPNNDIINIANSGSPCALCKNIRIKYINELLKKDPLKIEKRSFITGYTLFDIASYLHEILVLTNLKLMEYKKLSLLQRERINNMLHKFLPKEILPNGSTIERPLLSFSENLIQYYLKENSIPYIKTACNFEKIKHKRLYMEVIKNLNTIYTYNDIIEFVNNQGIDFSELSTVDNNLYFSDC